ncbi:MAG: hypothetical protein ABJA98_20870 [Acidobacteriota bacterium]
MSGQTFTYYAVNQAASGAARNYQTLETDYAPARTQYWHGVDVNLNARLRSGVTISGGTSTGRGVINTCALSAALPELLVVAGVSQRLDSCAITEPVETSLRGLASYTVPKVDVLISANVRSVPNANIGMGQLRHQRCVAECQHRLAEHRRPGDAGAIAGRWPGNRHHDGEHAHDGQVYGDRITQVDMRFAKIRATNLRPNAIVAPRFVRFNMAVNF